MSLNRVWKFLRVLSDEPAPALPYLDFASEKNSRVYLPAFFIMTVDYIWKLIPLSSRQLSLARVLRCGQAFRWKNINNVWSFSAPGQIILLRQDKDKLHYANIPAPGANPDPLGFIMDYFNLDVDVETLYEFWSTIEKKHKPGGKVTSFAHFPGIRMLRQDPWETVVLFICSSNNNVKRISKMCDALCTEFGDYVGKFEGTEHYSFPHPLKLAAVEVEAKLRELGFGYRAKYIQQTAAMFVDENLPEITLDSLHNLRKMSYEVAHEYLLQLKGVGPKVADCICLMALDKHDIVPVDTHVMQIAERDYKFKGPKTPKAYQKAGRYLQDLFGEYAGWAQLVMFAADLSDLDNGVNQIDGVVVKHEHNAQEASLQVDEKIIKVGTAKKRGIKTTVVKVEDLGSETGRKKRQLLRGKQLL